MHISDDFVESIFVAIYGVFETRRERAAATLFLSVLLERNTLPLTGAWGGWVLGGFGGGWLAGWLDAGAHPGPMGNLSPRAPHLPQPTPPLGWSGGAVHTRVVTALSSRLLLCRTLGCSLWHHPAYTHSRGPFCSCSFALAAWIVSRFLAVAFGSLA